MNKIPNGYVNYKSTPIFTVDNIPKMFLHLHNTKAGVYGLITVLSGELAFYGFESRRGEVELTINIPAGGTAVSPPEYWHKVEFLNDETSFKVDFYADKHSAIVAENQSERA
ncbi:DUF1971 domain-containing protein [Shewanella eurypsychrophilus]|uniref:DUF1971 domain-containing protein n=1 Tax=Shewanella eurypsychrophilus TaxID=2593656 RepID=A0ABX6V8N5_9GAMM|nr:MULTISPECIES: DUF1971 domain-containing protein [Shewanella]QFU21566.1 DUF1971 domain-containing protein [Shewanella sp. YLB-09]QPG56856.1 DUF1971 domain-containing protein [Shewanella eurypsychrophilus]